ncbi:MAG: DUF58 domain-containing protein [Limisphaerales bacterium]
MPMRVLHRLFLALRRLNRWLRRRFTPAGAFVLIGWILTASASDPDETMGLLVFVVLSVMLGMAVLMAPFFRMRFGIERQVPRFVTAGDPFQLRVRIHNRFPRSQRGLEYLEDVRDTPASVAEFAARLRPGRGNRSFRMESSLPPIRAPRTRPTPLPLLPAQGSVEAIVEIVAFRRGPLVLAGGLVARSDPFGLFRAFSRTAAPHTVLVLPRRYPLPPLTLPGQTQYQRGGVALAAGVGESEEFVALREYRRGDSLRRVHWRSTARRGELTVKEFQDEYFVRHALVLDTFCEASRDAAFEEAVAVAASFACTVPDQESLLDLMFVGPQTVCVTSGRGVGHAQQMLEVLAAVKPCREPRHQELEALVLRHSATLSGCLLVILEWDEPRRALVRRLKALRVPTLVMVIVPRNRKETFDPGPPADQPDRLLVLESGLVGEGLRRLEGAL